MTTIQDNLTEFYNSHWENRGQDMKTFGPFSRHIRRVIKSLVQPLEFETVLDVGCGSGLLLQELSADYPHIRPYGTDLSRVAIGVAHRAVPNGQFWIYDISQSVLNTKFDLVICSEVLEHIHDDLAAIQHLAQMTNKYLIISTPQGRMRRFEVEHVGHVRNYAYGELVRKLEQTGFNVIRVIEWGFPFYSPLYRDLLELTSRWKTYSQSVYGKFGTRRKLVAQIVYMVFQLNSARCGDEIFVLAEPRH
jgi:2-polyprenyl-3-methyl-5-hydroxy-6-metoxy-1,4-benzoquinol methylase